MNSSKAVPLRASVGWQGELLLKLQNRSKQESFTNTKIQCSDGYFWIHSVVLKHIVGQPLDDWTKNGIFPGDKLSIREAVHTLFGLYTGKTVMDESTLENMNNAYWFHALVGIESTLGNNVELMTSNSSLALAVINEFAGKVFRFTKINTDNGEEVGEFYVTIDGTVVPI